MKSVLGILFCAVLLSSCSQYRLAVKTNGSRSALQQSGLIVNITPLKDIRELFPENSELFNQRKTMTKGVIRYCMNDESRYNKETPIRFQVSEFLAERLKERGFFGKVQFNTLQNADYYIAGDIKSLFGMQAIGIDGAFIAEATAASRERISIASSLFGLVGGLIASAIEHDNMKAAIEKVVAEAPEELKSGDTFIVITISGLKVYGKNREFLGDIPDVLHVSYENRELDSFTCGNIYNYVNEGLDSALDIAAKYIEEKISELEKKKN